jgi:hypothetical protein
MLGATSFLSFDLATLDQLWESNDFMAFSSRQDKVHRFTKTLRFYMHFGAEATNTAP